MFINPYVLLIGVIFNGIAKAIENHRVQAPGDFVEVNGQKIHYLIKGAGKTTVILDHSLGGIEGYFLIDEIAKITRVCICDRPGYGWSQPSPNPRTSETIVEEWNDLLVQANIEPPYILVGDSFGSYNMRLFAQCYPEKVRALILTDGLHEGAMLNMPLAVKAVNYLFISGFIMSIIGSILGVIRLLGLLGLFESIKPELKQFDRSSLKWIKRSFYNYNHWLTMARELIGLESSGHQLKVANDLKDLPIISIKSRSFFKPSLLTKLLPLKQIDLLRDKIHGNLSLLSSNYTEIPANNSSHFVWIDEPELIVKAIRLSIART